MITTKDIKIHGLFVRSERLRSINTSKVTLIEFAYFAQDISIIDSGNRCANICIDIPTMMNAIRGIFAIRSPSSWNNIRSKWHTISWHRTEIFTTFSSTMKKIFEKEDFCIYITQPYLSLIFLSNRTSHTDTTL